MIASKTDTTDQIERLLAIDDIRYAIDHPQMFDPQKLQALLRQMEDPDDDEITLIEAGIHA